MKNIYILGATGSIGLQTIDVIKQNKAFELIGVSLGSDHQKNENILDAFNLKIASLRDDAMLEVYKQKYPKTTFVYGDQGLLDDCIV
jgi:1-deoxy-D-xylulose-5-phosphate reductoisomerase